MKNSMQPVLITAFLTSLAPLLFFSGTATDSNEQLVSLTHPLPYLLSTLLAFISLKLNQYRYVVVSLTLCAIYAYCQNQTPVILPSGLTDTAIVALFLPLFCMTLWGLNDRRLLGSRGMVGLITTSAILAILTPFIFSTKFAAYLSGDPVPDIAYGAFVGFLLLSLGTRDVPIRKQRLLGCASLVPTFFALEHRTLTGSSSQSTLWALSISSQLALLLYGIFLQYWEKVYLDELTRIPNRRALDEQLAKIRGQYVVSMIDVDHFKGFNDNYGHDQGDHVLRFLATHLHQQTRGNVFRYGGEEFAVLLVGITEPQAVKKIDDARRKLSSKKFHLRKPSDESHPSDVQITFSAGAASGDEETPAEEILSRADKALYAAKSGGRNCVVAYSTLKEQKTTRIV